MGEALRPLKPSESAIITKRDLDKEKLIRNQLDRKKETVEKIFGDFTAISGGQLLQADDEARLRKFQKEKFQKNYRAVLYRTIAILALKFVSGETLIKLVLKRIELKKKALLVNLDGNQPIFLD